jgi:hypothetical protein
LWKDRRHRFDLPVVAKEFLIVNLMSASDSWSAQRDALAAEVLRRTGRLRLQARGESMLPTLWPGDVAEIAACSLRDVGRGEIVLAFRDGRFFLHRFLTIEDHEGFLTRGDSMPGPDPAFPPNAFLGKLVGVIRNGQTMSTTVRVPAVGILFGYCGFARRVALRLHSLRNSYRLPLADLKSA